MSWLVDSVLSSKQGDWASWRWLGRVKSPLAKFPTSYRGFDILVLLKSEIPNFRIQIQIMYYSSLTLVNIIFLTLLNDIPWYHGIYPFLYHTVSTTSKWIHFFIEQEKWHFLKVNTNLPSFFKIHHLEENIP